MEWTDVFTAAVAFGGAFVGASIEVRKVRAQVDRLRRVVRACPHHDDLNTTTVRQPQ